MDNRKRLEKSQFELPRNPPSGIEDTGNEGIPLILSSNIYTEDESDVELPHALHPQATREKPVSSKKPKKKQVFSKGFANHELPANSQPALISELSLPTASRPTKSMDSFFARLKSESKSQFELSLASSVLQSQETESLLISAPAEISGFFSKKPVTNKRDRLKQSLYQAINDRRTSHMTSTLIFEKTTSSFIEQDSEFSPSNEDNSLSENELHSEEDSHTSEPPSEEDSPTSELPSKQEPHDLAREISDLSTIPEVLSNNKPRKRRCKFLDDLAELGSDNEAHDHLIKRASDSESDLDGDLAELIDNTQLATGAQQTTQKFMNDMIVQDHMDLGQVISGDFKRSRPDSFLKDSPGLTVKKAKLLQDTTNRIQGRDQRAVLVQQDASVLSESDDEDLHLISLIRQNSLLRNFRSSLSPELSMDRALLGMTQRPVQRLQHKSLMRGPRNTGDSQVFKEAAIGTTQVYSFIKRKSPFLRAKDSV